MKKFFTRMLGVCSLLLAFSFTSTEAVAQCAVVPPAGVTGACYAQVTSADPFCCDNSWDTLCQNAYDACVAGGGGCAAVPPAGVSGPCYDQVIAGDAFCCDNSWDTLCQSDYDACVAGGGSCAAVPAACVDVNSAAYATTIANDPFCCDNSWDTICQGAYDDLSATCDGTEPCVTTPDPCVIVNGAAYDQVILNDPFCCNNTWDSVCQDAYDLLSNSCTGACIAPPACVDINSAAYSNTIANDSFCCNFGWDSLCQSAYDLESATCDGTEPCVTTPDPCVIVNGAAYNQVILDDPFCCNNTWDSVCQDAYDLLSNSCTGACIAPPACVDVNGAAYATVIANDPFCCNTGWDSLCQSAYDGLSDTCVGGGCLVVPPACVDVNSAAYATVVANDAFCCNTGWDSICQGAYDGLSDTCTGGGCTAVAPACVDVNGAAYATVIANDAFCCNNTWDSICQDAYDLLSDSCLDPCNVDGGTVSSASQLTQLCKGDGDQDFIQINVAGNVGVGFFGIVRQSDLEVVATNQTGLFNVENFPAGQYFAGHVSVEDAAQLAGVTNVNQLSGCFDLSNQLAVTSIQLAGGTVTTSSTTVCGGTVTATVAGNQGPQGRFALLNQTATVVIAQNTTGVFNFNSLATGIYRIVHISYTGNVNLGAIMPPVLPPCVAPSNLVTVTKVACATAVLESSPNPTPGTSYVTFTVPTEEYTTLEVYDMSGRKVTELFNQVTQKDVEYRLEFNGVGLPNGVYIYRLTTGSEVIIDKFMIAK